MENKIKNRGYYKYLLILYRYCPTVVSVIPHGLWSRVYGIAETPKSRKDLEIKVLDMFLYFQNFGAENGIFGIY